MAIWRDDKPITGRALDLALTRVPKRFQVLRFAAGDSGLGARRAAIVKGDGMNKNDLIGAVAETAGLSKSDAASAVEGVFDAITGALKKGDEVRLVGFGTFTVARRKASTGRNPRTGEPMKIKASNQPKFKAGKVLKDSVN
jgi:DNA-binding protein HU-beta